MSKEQTKEERSKCCGAKITCCNGCDTVICEKPQCAKCRKPFVAEQTKEEKCEKLVCNTAMCSKNHDHMIIPNDCEHYWDTSIYKCLKCGIEPSPTLEEDKFEQMTGLTEVAKTIPKEAIKECLPHNDWREKFIEQFPFPATNSRMMEYIQDTIIPQVRKEEREKVAKFIDENRHKVERIDRYVLTDLLKFLSQSEE